MVRILKSETWKTFQIFVPFVYNMIISKILNVQQSK